MNKRSSQPTSNYDRDILRDLDLNSSRTQIIKSDKWVRFEEDLAFAICSGVRDSVSEDYWNTWKGIMKSESKNDVFLSGLGKIAERERAM
jgi:hypothetical protein